MAARLRCLRLDVAAITALRRLGGLRHARGAADDSGAHRKLDPAQGRIFRLPARQNALAVMRLDPALEKAGRHREPHGLAVDPFDFHAREPAGEDVLSDLGAQPLPHALPALLARAVRLRTCLLRPLLVDAREIYAR